MIQKSRCIIGLAAISFQLCSAIPYQARVFKSTGQEPKDTVILFSDAHYIAPKGGGLADSDQSLAATIEALSKKYKTTVIWEDTTEEEKNLLNSVYKGEYQAIKSYSLLPNSSLIQNKLSAETDFILSDTFRTIAFNILARVRRTQVSELDFSGLSLNDVIASINKLTSKDSLVDQKLDLIHDKKLSRQVKSAWNTLKQSSVPLFGLVDTAISNSKNSQDFFEMMQQEFSKNQKAKVQMTFLISSLPTLEMTANVLISNAPLRIVFAGGQHCDDMDVFLLGLGYKKILDIGTGREFAGKFEKDVSRLGLSKKAFLTVIETVEQGKASVDSFVLGEKDVNYFEGSESDAISKLKKNLQFAWIFEKFPLVVVNEKFLQRLVLKDWADFAAALERDGLISKDTLAELVEYADSPKLKKYLAGSEE